MFPLTAPDWLDELDVVPGGPPVLHMGLRPVEVNDWLIVDEAREAELEHKSELLRSRYAEVYAALPETELAGAEVLAQVVQNLRQHHDIEVVPDPALSPLDAAGRLVQEDLCVMTPHEGGYILGAASLCFPSGWYLKEKLGRPMTAIHEPIPHYRTELASKVDNFFDRLKVDRPVQRRNWFIYDDNSLFQPADPVTDLGPDVRRPLFLRSERQTLRRLPESQAIIFTIRTQRVELAQLAIRPDIAMALAAYFRTSPAVVQRIKGVAPYLPEALRQLDELAAEAPSPLL